MSTMKVNTPVERDGESDDETVVKKSECKSMVEGYKCSISRKLPIEPVMASDVS